MATWKQKGRWFGLCLLAASFVSANAGPGASLANTPSFDATGQVVHADSFLAHIWGNSGSKVAMVRISYPGGFVWLTPVTVSGEGHWGQHNGRIVQFDTSDVEDWAFETADGRFFGYFGLRRQLDELSVAQAADISRVLTDTVVPSGWSTDKTLH